MEIELKDGGGYTINEKELEKANIELKKIQRLKRELYTDYKEELISKGEYIQYKEDYDCLPFFR